MLYPSVSDYMNKVDSSEIITDYNNKVTSMQQETYESILEEAREYNRQLLINPQKLISGEPQSEEYSNALNISSDGIMGYITIKKLDINLPICHGTSDSQLSKMVGHVEGSSLPVGGKGTNAVLAGHRGLPSAKLFTDLDELTIGDTFTITVLKETMTYEIDEIKVVLPEELSDITVDLNEDYVTLVTCTPYAVNTHRLLVRGRRVEETEISDVPADADMINTETELIAILVPVFVVCVLVVCIEICRKKKSKGGK